jgi:beta-1,4-mannosyltransferase
MQLNVLMLPDWRAGNPYQDLLAQSVRDAGARVEFADYPQQSFALNRVINRNPHVNVLHLHWPNPLFGPLFWDGSRVPAFLRMGLLIVDIALARARGRRIIWTLHNLVSHESKDAAREAFACKMLARLSHRIIAHSRSAIALAERVYNTQIAHKAHVIPMGNFDGIYSSATPAPPPRAPGAAAPIHILFFGAVRPYKGLKRLLRAFSEVTDPRVRLTIAGRAMDAKYGESIASLAAQDARIDLQLRFVDVPAVSPLFAKADVVIIPFERTLTSASLMLAMSLTRTCILPDEARIFDIVNDENSLFFDSDASLVSLLNRLDHTTLHDKALAARRTADALNWPAVGEATVEAYRRAGA